MMNKVTWNSDDNEGVTITDLSQNTLHRLDRLAETMPTSNTQNDQTARQKANDALSKIWDAFPQEYMPYALQEWFDDIRAAFKVTPSVPAAPAQGDMKDLLAECFAAMPKCSDGQIATAMIMVENTVRFLATTNRLSVTDQGTLVSK